MWASCAWTTITTSTTTLSSLISPRWDGIDPPLHTVLISCFERAEEGEEGEGEEEWGVGSGERGEGR